MDDLGRKSTKEIVALVKQRFGAVFAACPETMSHKISLAWDEGGDERTLRYEVTQALTPYLGNSGGSPLRQPVILLPFADSLKIRRVLVEVAWIGNASSLINAPV